MVRIAPKVTSRSWIGTHVYMQQTFSMTQVSTATVCLIVFNIGASVEEGESSGTPGTKAGQICSTTAVALSAHMWRRLCQTRLMRLQHKPQKHKQQQQLRKRQQKLRKRQQHKQQNTQMNTQHQQA